VTTAGSSCRTVYAELGPRGNVMFRPKHGGRPPAQLGGPALPDDGAGTGSSSIPICVSSSSWVQ